MAVLRESKPTSLVTQAVAPDVRQSSGGAVKTPNVRKFQKDPSTADLLIDAVVPEMQKFGQKAWDAQKEEAYLSGVRQASLVESEEDLQASTFTKDWATAGFRDTKGRGIQADFVANIPGAIQNSLAEPDPQQAFSDWLAQQQQNLVSSYDGMSRTARAASFAQNAVDMQTAQRTFTKEYAKHIISTEERSLQASFTAMRQQLDTTKDDPKAYASASNAFASNVYKNVWLNDKLPLNNKIALTKQAVEYAASSDNVQVYDILKQTQFNFPGGKSGTIMQQMPFEEQVALDKVQRQAMERTKVIRAADFEDTMARQRAEWSDVNGPGPTISYGELVAQLDTAMDANILAAGKRESILKEYFTAASRNGGNDVLAQAYAAGDFPSIVKAGKSEDDALRAYLKANEGQPYQSTVQGLLSIGNNSGMNSAFTKAGELMAPTLGQLGYGKDIDPESANMANSFIQMLDQAEQQNPGTYARAMAGLSSDNQDMLLHMREAQRTGIADPATAVQFARDQILKQNQLGTLAATMIAEANREDSKAIREIGDRQLLGTLSGAAKSFFSGDAATKQRLSTGRMWFENEARTAEVRATAQLALSEELAIIAKTSPMLPADARMSKALGNMSARTVDTEGGPLIIPRGANLSRYFGTPQYADQAYIGKAIDQLVPAGEGQRVAWSPTPDGQLLFRKYNEDGQVAESGVLNPLNVGVKVQENLDLDSKTASNEIGPGKVVSKGGASVQYNGDNTAGFQNSSMLLLRDDIVNSEGISNTAYNDGTVVKGNKSFGVGISQTGKRFQKPLGRDGLYTQTQINNSFMEASNDAAETASRVMRGTNLAGDDWLRFFGELAYQSPASARDKDMLAHIVIGDKNGAEMALRNTNAFKNSPPERQEQYLRKLNKAMR